MCNRRIMLIIGMLCIILGLSGCTEENLIAAYRVWTLEKSEALEKTDDLYLDVGELAFDGSLAWREEQEGETNSDAKSYFVIHDFNTGELSEIRLPEELEFSYMIKSNFPEGIILVQEVEAEYFVFYSVGKGLDIRKRYEAHIEDASRIVALYDGVLYYVDMERKYHRKSLITNEEYQYSENWTDLICLSPDGKLLSVASCEKGNRLFVFTPKNEPLEISVPETCVAINDVDIVGSWIDENHAYLIIPLEADGSFQDVLYLYSYENNSLEPCYTADGQILVLEDERHDIFHDSMAVGCNDNYIAYKKVIPWNSIYAGKTPASQFEIIVVSVKTGEKYRIHEIIGKRYTNSELLNFFE